MASLFCSKQKFQVFGITAVSNLNSLFILPSSQYRTLLSPSRCPSLTNDHTWVLCHLAFSPPPHIGTARHLPAPAMMRTCQMMTIWRREVASKRQRQSEFSGRLLVGAINPVREGVYIFLQLPQNTNHYGVVCVCVFFGNIERWEITHGVSSCSLTCYS